MNNKITSVFIFIASLLAVTSQSFAAFDTYRMVGALNETTEKTVFGFDETPYLYLKLPAEGQASSVSFWQDPRGAPFYTAANGTDIERWISIADWNSVKKTGRWEVNSNYFYTNGDTGSGSTSFTVTPEPLAVTLFLMGGAPIAADIYRRRRRLLKV
jgi:hypothetical protein